MFPSLGVGDTAWVTLGVYNVHVCMLCVWGGGKGVGREDKRGGEGVRRLLITSTHNMYEDYNTHACEVGTWSSINQLMPFKLYPSTHQRTAFFFVPHVAVMVRASQIVPLYMQAVPLRSPQGREGSLCRALLEYSQSSTCQLTCCKEGLRREGRQGKRMEGERGGKRGRVEESGRGGGTEEEEEEVKEGRREARRVERKEKDGERGEKES